VSLLWREASRSIAGSLPITKITRWCALPAAPHSSDGLLIDVDELCFAILHGVLFPYDHALAPLAVGVTEGLSWLIPSWLRRPHPSSLRVFCGTMGGSTGELEDGHVCRCYR
jgi:hypothetical protein